MYVKRHAEKIINTLSKMFGALLVIGARQVGKTTLLRKSIPIAEWISLDNPIVLNSARNEASTFLREHDTPPSLLIRVLSVKCRLAIC